MRQIRHDGATDGRRAPVRVDGLQLVVEGRPERTVHFVQELIAGTTRLPLGRDRPYLGIGPALRGRTEQVERGDARIALVRVGEDGGSERGNAESSAPTASAGA